MASRYFTTAQVAELLVVTADKVTDLIHTGQLLAVNVALHVGGKARWRISNEALDEFLLRRSSSPAPKHHRKKKPQGRKYYL